MPSGRKPSHPYTSSLERDAAKKRADKEGARRRQFADALATVTDRLVTAGLQKQSQTRWTETEKLQTALDFLRQLKAGNEELTAKLDEYLDVAGGTLPTAATQPQYPPTGDDWACQWPLTSSSSFDQLEQTGLHESPLTVYTPPANASAAYTNVSNNEATLATPDDLLMPPADLAALQSFIHGEPLPPQPQASPQPDATINPQWLM